MSRAWWSTGYLITCGLVGTAFGILLALLAWNGSLSPLLIVVTLVAVLLGFAAPVLAMAFLNPLVIWALVAGVLGAARGSLVSLLVGLGICVVAILGRIALGFFTGFFSELGPGDGQEEFWEHVFTHPIPERGRGIGLSLAVVGVAIALILGFTSFWPSGNRTAVDTSSGGSASAEASQAAGYALATADGTPMRWDPCEGPISVQINYGDLPPAYREKAKGAVADALRQLRATTGLQFRYAGSSRAPFPVDSAADRRSGKDAIVIAFLPRATGLLSRSGAPDSVRARATADVAAGGNGWAPIVAGDVQVAPKAEGYDSTGYTKHVLAGLGVAMGLADGVAGGPSDVLSSGSSTQLTAYGPGDRAGLAVVGSAAGCFDR